MRFTLGFINGKMRVMLCLEEVRFGQNADDKQNKCSMAERRHGAVDP